MVLRLVILLIALGVGWQVHPSLELVALGDILQPPNTKLPGLVPEHRGQVTPLLPGGSPPNSKLSLCDSPTNIPGSYCPYQWSHKPVSEHRPLKVGAQGLTGHPMRSKTQSTLGRQGAHSHPRS